MTADWQAFLTSQAAHWTEDRVQHFGDPQGELQAAAGGTVIADLSQLGLLQLAGEDRYNFLQGQVTNDVKLLDGGNSQYAGYCTPKGRLLALPLVFAHQDKLYLQLNGQLREAIAKRLKMYILRAKVTLTDVSGQFVRLGLAGPQAEATLRTRFGQVPERAHALIEADGALLLRLPGDTARFELLLAPARAAEIWQALAATARPVGAPCWEWLEIQAGIPDIGPATQEAFVPQMVNLDALGGISYKKGCYTGQEIVARTHYLGKVKRRTLPLHIADETAAAGDPVHTADGGEPVGMLVRVAPAPGGGWDALAELRLAAIEQAELFLNPAEGRPLRPGALPYALDEAATTS